MWEISKWAFSFLSPKKWFYLIMFSLDIKHKVFLAAHIACLPRNSSATFWEPKVLGSVILFTMTDWLRLIQGGQISNILSLPLQKKVRMWKLSHLVSRYEAVGHPPASQGNPSCSALPVVRGWWRQTSLFVEFCVSHAFCLKITNFETFAVPSSRPGKLEREQSVSQ